MELENLFKRIDEEIKLGDIKDACNRAGVTSQVYTNLRKRKSIQEVTAMEQEVLTKLIGLLNERREQFGHLLGTC